MQETNVKLDREQLIFVVETILCAALDRIESGLPTCIDWGDRFDEANFDPALPFSAYEHGVLEATGMSLAVLYAQLTDDGLGIGDALAVADKFDDACHKMFYAAWEDKGEAVKKKLRNGGTGGTYIGDLLPHWPDTLHHATAFVDNLWGRIDIFVVGECHRLQGRNNRELTREKESWSITAQHSFFDKSEIIGDASSEFDTEESAVNDATSLGEMYIAQGKATQVTIFVDGNELKTLRKEHTD